MTCASSESSPWVVFARKAHGGGVTPNDAAMPLFHSVARESRLVLCLSVFTVSSIAGTRQEKAGHGPGTEYSACLRKSSYSSEYVNDAIAI